MNKTSRFPQTMLCTFALPWDAQKRLMEDALRRQIRTVIAAGIEDVYIFGTAGEGHAVDMAQFRDIVHLFREETDGKAERPQVGVIALSTGNIIERIGMAHELGFRIFQISLPCWGALNDDELLVFFRDVCGAFPDSRFVHYDLDRAKRRLSSADYRKICDDVPNLAAAKVTGLDLENARAVMKEVPELQPFFTEPLFARASRFGACSLLSAYAALSLKRAIRFFNAGREGRFEEADALAEGYIEFNRKVFAPSLGDTRYTDGAYDKIIARLGGNEVPMRMLSPYLCGSEETFRACEAIYRKEFPDWPDDAR
jgi:dihydrodipicolinate synthase/N-acetylneuraminate lyase